ncbi:MAG: transcription elongation factor GreA [Alphaproteobacteria bacterium]
MERVPMTANGFTRLQEELKRLKSVERPRVLKALEEARAHGDLSENAEYEAARHEQGLIEGRISELETKTRNAQVIDVTKLSGDDVKFGATVQLQDVDGNAKVTYQVVGADEADIKAGLLSVTSPLGRALIGKSEGALLEVSAPGGVKTYELLKVEYK